MVNLPEQYVSMKSEIDAAVINVITSGQYINGPEVELFALEFARYMEVAHVIPCANGTDALQIALMSLDLNPGDEVIIPAFTYVATAEAIALLGLVPRMIDVDEFTFNIDVNQIEDAINTRTKVIIPVHLYGQASNMEAIMYIADKHQLHVIEDNAQAIGAAYKFEDGKTKKLGSIGHISCTSFFPTKTLAAYGDGGAVMTNDALLAKKIKMIANHGQSSKYYHDMVGCNSRLDTLQAAVLRVKLNYLEKFNSKRLEIANHYDVGLKELDQLSIPVRAPYATHVFHQYTLKIGGNERDALKKHLSENGIASMVYYPLPLYKQNAYKNFAGDGFELPVTERLCKDVLSIPIHPELNLGQASFIVDQIKQFYYD